MTTILLVDDDPLDAFVRKSALETRFHDVQRVADPVEALWMMEQPHFADRVGLVVAGLHRPGLNDSQFVAEMHVRLPGVPVLVLGRSRTPADEPPEEGVRFLGSHSASEEMLSAASQLLASEGISPRIQ
jgi:CheY-like chemotaxis protein